MREFQNMKRQINWLVKQIKCLKSGDCNSGPSTCECEFQPTALEFNAASDVLTSTYADGSIQNADISQVYRGTYAELKVLKDANELKIGKKYILTDYKTEYYIEGTNTAPIEKEITNVALFSGWAYYEQGINELVLGSQIEVTYLPSTYTGPIQVGDITTVSQYFDPFYMKFANGIQFVIGSKFKFTVDRFTVNNSMNNIQILDDNGKIVAKPLGVINTEVHDGTPYMDMSAIENPTVSIEEISLTAISENTFSLDAESLTFVGDSLEYNFNNSDIKNEDDILIGSRKGFIERRINEKLNIDIDKDWRVQRYRRYKITEIEDWNNYILNNSTDHTLYEMGGNNSCSISNLNITEEHKYILPFIENKKFYQDFTKNGIEPNIFLTGKPTVPNIVYGYRYATQEQDEFKHDLISQIPKKAKDFTIFTLQNNSEPDEKVVNVKINKLRNTIFLKNNNQLGDSGSLSINIKDGIGNSTFMSHAFITSDSYVSNFSLNNITSIDTFGIQNNGVISNLHAPSTGSINNSGTIVFLTVGGFLANIRPFGTTYLDLTFDNNCIALNTIFGGKRVDRLKFSNCLLTKFLYTWDRSQYVIFEDSSCFLTALKGYQDNYTSKFKINTAVDINSKKSAYGYFYDVFTNGTGKNIINNDVGDLFFKTYDSNNSNATIINNFSISQ